MPSEIDRFLDEIDEWKFKLFEKLKNMTPEEELAYFRQAGEEAQARGLKYMELEEVPKPRKKRAPRTSGNGAKKRGTRSASEKRSARKRG